MKKKKTRIKEKRVSTKLLKICISLVLIILIISRLDWPEFVKNVQAIDIRLYVFAVALSFLEISVRAVRWQQLLKAKDMHITFAKALSFMLVGMFFGLFLPTSLGGDIAKMYDFSNHSSKPVDTFSSIFMERWSGITSLAFIGLFDIIIYYNRFSPDVKRLTVVSFAIIAICSLLIFSSDLYKKFFGLFSSDNKLLKSLENKVESLMFSIREYREHKMLMVSTFLLALLVNVLRVSINFVNSQALGINISFSYFFLFIPIIILILMVPISISGIGVREGAYLYFFSKVGMDAQSAILISWMSFVVIIFYSIVGGVIFGLRRNV